MNEQNKIEDGGPAARTDTDRLNWLESTKTGINYNVECCAWGVDFEAPYGSNIRAAIDVGMGQPPAPPPQANQNIGPRCAAISPRDHFRGRAMQALILCHAAQIECQKSETSYLVSFNGDEAAFDNWLAKRSSEIADAMLAERKKGAA